MQGRGQRTQPTIEGEPRTQGAAECIASASRVDGRYGVWGNTGGAGTGDESRTARTFGNDDSSDSAFEQRLGSTKQLLFVFVRCNHVKVGKQCVG